MHRAVLVWAASITTPTPSFSRCSAARIIREGGQKRKPGSRGFGVTPEKARVDSLLHRFTPHRRRVVHCCETDSSQSISLRRGHREFYRSHLCFSRAPPPFLRVRQRVMAKSMRLRANGSSLDGLYVEHASPGNHSSSDPGQGLPLADCVLRFESVFKPCGCNNVCVLTMVLLTPLVILGFWAAYFMLSHLLRRRWPSIFPEPIGWFTIQLPFNQAVLVQAARRAEQLERAALAAIQALPSFTWGCERHVSECCLCMEPLEKSQVVRQLRCGHLFHLHCIDRWMIYGQRNHERRCPLCRCDPLREGGAGGGGRPGTSIAPAAFLATNVRRGSEGKQRAVIGQPIARRHSSPSDMQVGLKCDNTCGSHEQRGGMLLL